MEEDDVMLRKKAEDRDDGLSVLDKMIMWSRNKPLSKEELAAFGPADKKCDQGLVVRPWVTIKSIGEGKRRESSLVVGVQGTF